MIANSEDFETFRNLFLIYTRKEIILCFYVQSGRRVVGAGSGQICGWLCALKIIHHGVVGVGVVGDVSDMCMHGCVR